MNVLIVEDHISVREGVEFYLKQNIPTITNIRVASNGSEAIKVFNNTEKIDILITDLNMPIMNGFELISTVESLYPSLKIMVFTMYYNFGILNKLKDLRISAFLCKNASLSEFPLAFDAIANDTIFKSQELPKVITSEESYSSDIQDNFAQSFMVTPREQEVLKHLADNLTNIEIGTLLHLSPETIKGHRKNIYRKLGVNNVLDLYKLLLSSNYFK